MGRQAPRRGRRGRSPSKGGGERSGSGRPRNAGGKQPRGGDRPRDPELVARELEALYAELPSIDCKGRCWKCCSRVLMAPGERERVAREAGVHLPTVEEMREEHRDMCPALKSHRCTVYDLRPLMCRMWGLEETMRCPYGCVPEGGWMTHDEASLFFYRAYVIAGWPVEDEEDLTQRQVITRLRRHQAHFDALPEEKRARIPRPEREPPRAKGLLRRWRG